MFSFQEHKLPLVGISDIAECKDGILFVYDTGLLVCVDRDRLTVRWIKEEVKNDNQDGKQIDFSLFVDREECIWIYSISGVWVYDLEKGNGRKTLRNVGVTVLTLCIALRRMLKAEFGWARIIAV